MMSGKLDADVYDTQNRAEDIFAAIDLSYINNNFDDWSDRRGMSKSMEVSADNKVITETLALGTTEIATRITTFNTDGSITEVVSFKAYRFEDTDGNVIRATDHSTTKTTTIINGVTRETIK